jgi:putative transposase
MTNHFHLLVTPGSDMAVSRVMQAVGVRYVQHFNKTYGRTGTLWEGRYRATLVETGAYLFTCHRYIELNPVRAGLVSDPRDYPWSSHAANALGMSDPLVTPHGEYLSLDSDASSRRAAYRALFHAVLPDASLEEIRTATNTGWVLGSKRFRKEVAALVSQRTERERAPRVETMR